MEKGSDALKLAAELIDGDRNKTHGTKDACFNLTAQLWKVALSAGELDGEMVAWMMSLHKMARRYSGLPIEDHYCDAAGYIGCAFDMAKCAGDLAKSELPEKESSSGAES